MALRFLFPWYRRGVRTPVRGSRARMAASALALLLLAITELAATARALAAPAPGGRDGCARAMACCKTGFCPLSHRPGRPRLRGRAWESCRQESPTATAAPVLRPPAVLAMTLPLPPPARAWAPAALELARTASLARAPELPPPESAR
jgi:hypothetical protein